MSGFGGKGEKAVKGESWERWVPGVTGQCTGPERAGRTLQGPGLGNGSWALGGGREVRRGQVQIPKGHSARNQGRARSDSRSHGIPPAAAWGVDRADGAGG